MPKSLAEAKENQKGQRKGSGKRRRCWKNGAGRGHKGKRFPLSVTPGPLDTHEPQMAGWGWGGVGEWLTLK